MGDHRTKGNEEKLRESEKKYKELIDGMNEQFGY
jgi:hypothetical protein